MALSRVMAEWQAMPPPTGGDDMLARVDRDGFDDILKALTWAAAQKGMTVAFHCLELAYCQRAYDDHPDRVRECRE